MLVNKAVVTEMIKRRSECCVFKCFCGSEQICTHLPDSLLASLAFQNHMRLSGWVDMVLDGFDPSISQLAEDNAVILRCSALSVACCRNYHSACALILSVKQADTNLQDT